MAYDILTAMPEAEYHLLDNISASKLKMVHQSPSHFDQSKEFKSTPDMEMGTAFHSVILEPEKKGVLLCQAKTAAVKDYKAMVEKYPDKLVLTQPRWELLEKMVLRFRATKMHTRMMAGEGASELTIIGELEGIKTKCRIDRVKYLPKDRNRSEPEIIIYDLKTIAKMPKDARGFLYTVLDWGYHIQAAWYIDMCKAAGLIPRKFYFIFQEKVAPFNSYQVHLSEELIEIGRKAAYEAFDLYKECLEKDEWPSPYDQGEVGSLCIEAPEWMT